MMETMSINGKQDNVKNHIEKYNDSIVCECGYSNKKENVKRYGTCTRCRKVLDKKAKYMYEMYTRLRLWRRKK